MSNSENSGGLSRRHALLSATAGMAALAGTARGADVKAVKDRGGELQYAAVGRCEDTIREGARLC